MAHTSSAHVDRERWHLLEQVVHLLELPMAILGILWMALLAIDLAGGLHGSLARISGVIWIIFIVDFFAELLIAPNRLVYLKRHWLVVPALRVVRFARVVHVARAARGVPVAHTLAALNRAIAALNATLQRRGFGYVALFTLVLTFVGASAILALESGTPDPNGIHDYGTALWWTAMLMTTLGPTYWPVTIGGRILCFALALYAFSIFGYVAATLATFFIDRDAARADAAVAGQPAIEALGEKIDALRHLVEARLPPAA